MTGHEVAELAARLCNEEDRRVYQLVESIVGDSEPGTPTLGRRTASVGGQMLVEHAIPDPADHRELVMAWVPRDAPEWLRRVVIERQVREHLGYAETVDARRRHAEQHRAIVEQERGGKGPASRATMLAEFIDSARESLGAATRWPDSTVADRHTRQAVGALIQAVELLGRER